MLRNTRDESAARCLMAIGLFQFLMDEIFGVEPELRDLIPGQITGLSEDEYRIYLAGFVEGQEKMVSFLQQSLRKETHDDVLTPIQ